MVWKSQCVLFAENADSRGKNPDNETVTNCRCHHQNEINQGE